MDQPLSFDDWFRNYQATANSDAGQQTFLGPNQQAHDAYNIYLQGQYPVGDPRSYAPGFLQSQYGPGYQSVLDQLNAGGGNTGDLQALLRNWSSAYTAGKPYEAWQSDAATSAQGTPIIGGGKYGLDAATIGQLALGGAGGAAYGAGGGSGATSGGLLDAGAGVGTGSAVGASGGAGAGAAPTLGQVGGLLSGGSAALNALNGGGGQPTQGGAGGVNTGGIIGSLLGGALGGMQGGNRPAGTTTTTTNQTLAPGGMQQLQNTISGQYLDPATNPYLNQTYDAAARQITPRVNSLFEASGRYGSGAHQGVLGQTLSDLGTSIYGGNYNAERSRQLAAAGTPVGNTVTNPYFTNPLGGALSGALAGGVLGGGTGFLGGTNGGILNGIGGLFSNAGTGGTSDQTANWNPSMPLPDYYSGSAMGGSSSPAQTLGAPSTWTPYGGGNTGFSPNNSWNPSTQSGANYMGGFAPTYPSPTSVDQYTRTLT